MRAVLDFLGQFFPQLNALRGIPAAAEPGVAAVPARGFDLAGLMNASGLNMSALVNATAVAARAAKHREEQHASGGDLAAAADGAAANVPEDGVSGALGGILSGMTAAATQGDRSVTLHAAVVLSQNADAVTDEELLAMRKKLADAAGVPLAAVSASRSAASIRAGMLAASMPPQDVISQPGWPGLGNASEPTSAPTTAKGDLPPVSAMTPYPPDDAGAYVPPADGRPAPTYNNDRKTQIPASDQPLITLPPRADPSSGTSGAEISFAITLPAAKANQALNELRHAGLGADPVAASALLSTDELPVTVTSISSPLPERIIPDSAAAMAAGELPSLDAGLADTLAAMMPTDWKEMVRTLAMNVLESAAGSMAPRASLVLLRGDPTPVAKVASASLSAPIVGFGASLGGAGSSTARAVPGDASQQPITTCAALGYPHYESTAGSTDAPFWQPRAVAPYNWLLNAGEYPDGTARRFCPVEHHLVGSSGYAVDTGRLWGRAYLPRAVVAQSQLLPTEAQERQYARMSDAELRAQDEALDALELEVCPVDHLQLMRTEQMALCRESFVATGQTVASTSSLYDHLLQLPDSEGQAASSLDRAAGDGRVRITARDAQGNPLAGRYCNVTDLSDDGYDLLPLTLSYTCGPSGADGVMLLENLQITGGASRRLKLVVRVDGVLARAAADAPWAFDTTLRYVSSAQPGMQHTGLLSLGILGYPDNNHDSVMLLSLFGLAVLAINALNLEQHDTAVGRPEGRARVPPFFVRMLGMLALLVLVHTNAALWAHMVTGLESGTSVVAIGLRDMIAMQHGDDVPMAAHVLGASTMLLATFILLLVTVLYLRSAKREYLRARRMVEATNIARMARSLRAKVDTALGGGEGGADGVGGAGGSGAGAGKEAALVGAAPPKPNKNELALALGKCRRGMQRARSAVGAAAAWLAELCRQTASMAAQLSAPLRARWRRHFPLPAWEGREGDGALEPGYWYESHAHARQRTARNHVRLMLRGGTVCTAAAAATQERINRRSWRQFWRGCRGARLDVDVAQAYDDQAVFYYPERLYMAFAVSVWLQVLLAAVVFSFAAWVDGVVLYAQQKAAAALDDAASASLGDAGASKTSPVELALNLLLAEASKYFAVYLATAQAIFGDGFLRPFAVVIGCLQLLYVVLLWRGIFVRYRKRLLRMRRGDYFFARYEFSESGSSMYIGYQVAFIAVVCVIFFWVAVAVVCLAAVVFIAVKSVLVVSSGSVKVPEGAKSFDDPFYDFSDPPLAGAAVHKHALHAMGAHLSSLLAAGAPEAAPTAIMSPAELKRSVGKVFDKLGMGSMGLPVFLVAVVCPLLFQLFMNRSVFFAHGAGRVSGGTGNVWVRYRFWYAIYEYLMIMPNFLIGFYMLLYRLVMSFFLNLYYAPALDVCLFPEPTGWSKWEVGFCTYVSLIRTDHRYSSPVCTVFFDLLLETLSTNRLQRGRQKLRRELVKRSVARSFDRDSVTALAAEARPARGFFGLMQGGKGAGSSSAGADARVGLPPGANRFDAEELRLSVFDSFVPSPEYLRARNRWQLARTLLANPSLRAYRYHRLTVNTLPPVNNPYARFRQKLAQRFAETDRSLAKTRDGCGPALKGLPHALKGLPQKARECPPALAEKARACPAPLQKAGREAADDLKAKARAVPPAAKEAADVTVAAAKAVAAETVSAAKTAAADAKSLLQKRTSQKKED